MFQNCYKMFKTILMKMTVHDDNVDDLAHAITKINCY